MQNLDLFIGFLIFIAWLLANAVVEAAHYSKFQKLFYAVNAQLPPQRRFSYLWWAGDKHVRLLREYRSLYPSGRLIQEMRTLGIIQSLIFALLPSAVGFPVIGIFMAVLGAVVTWFIYKV